jgi:uncharacterized Zn-binding protein involved in type VI secretion
LEIRTVVGLLQRFIKKGEILMPPVARGNGTDSVFSKTGTGKNCPNPVGTATAACSGDVLANGIGVVRLGDAVAAHNAAGCGPDGSAISAASGTVFANFRNLARIGDLYTGDNIITSGSSSVFSG